MRKYFYLALVLIVVWIPTTISRYYFGEGVECSENTKIPTNCVEYFEKSVAIKSSKEATANRDYLKGLKAEKKADETLPPEKPENTNSSSGSIGSGTEAGWTNSGSTASWSESSSSGATSTASWNAQTPETATGSENIPGFSSTGSFESPSGWSTQERNARIEKRSTELEELQKDAQDYTRLDGMKAPNEIQSLLDSMFGGGSQADSKDY